MAEERGIEQTKELLCFIFSLVDAIKKSTGKNALEHATSYLEKNNPDKKKEKCISFVEATNSEVCAAMKNDISKNEMYQKIFKSSK